MTFSKWQSAIKNFDTRRDIAALDNYDQTIEFCVEFIIEEARLALLEKETFSVALSGGSTPKAIFKKLASTEYRERINWNKVLFFFGDERSVEPSSNESNYKMAMDNLLSPLQIPEKNIFRMVAETDMEENAQKYESLIENKILNAQFDLVMLGMGDDGHTASLFPNTEALKITNTLVCKNVVPQKDTTRMTLTYPCINQAHKICFFVLGANKAEVLKEVLEGPYDPTRLPSQKIGTSTHKALWILDKNAAKDLDFLRC